MFGDWSGLLKVYHICQYKGLDHCFDTFLWPLWNLFNCRSLSHVTQTCQHCLQSSRRVIWPHVSTRGIHSNSREFTVPVSLNRLFRVKWCKVLNSLSSWWIRLCSKSRNDLKVQSRLNVGKRQKMFLQEIPPTGNTLRNSSCSCTRVLVFVHCFDHFNCSTLLNCESLVPTCKDGEAPQKT